MGHLDRITIILAFLNIGGEIECSWWLVVAPMLFKFMFLWLTKVGVWFYNLFAKKKVKIVENESTIDENKQSVKRKKEVV